MRKCIIMIACIGLLLALLLTSAYSQEDMVTVDNSAFENARRTPSVFKHDVHNQKAGIDECSQCHHVYVDGQLIEDESSEDQKCFDCHKIQPDGRKPGLMKAFHLNCKGCHVKEKTGPVMCGECHKKKK